mmetsp:Transcript_22772/g.91227  ORF Transcript_22772/g.91227 Transcript_22772/m.91227 type:complete len:83 (-) Transcript_22772:2266-2514(-)
MLYVMLSNGRKMMARLGFRPEKASGSENAVPCICAPELRFVSVGDGANFSLARGRMIYLLLSVSILRYGALCNKQRRKYLPY